ncbi:MAG TPA: outer membrane beta-barrel protein, partial [Bacteroidia bacterium]|nr:outer membrane beta-barrel protein [Bacteroidia bacterium]
PNITPIMKRLLFILPLLILVTEAKAQRFRVGFMAGLTINDVSGADLVDADNDFKKPGFSISGLVNTKIGNTTQLQMEIAFIEKGSAVLPDSTNNNLYYNLNLNYIDVSVLIRQPLHIAVNKKMSDKYGLLIGGTYGTLISYSYTVQSNPTPIDLNNFDASAFIGFYYNFTPKFFIDLRYSNSIIPAIKRDASTSTFYPYFNSWNRGDNMSFEIRLGFIFGTSGDIGGTEPAAPAPTGGN